MMKFALAPKNIQHLVSEPSQSQSMMRCRQSGMHAPPRPRKKWLPQPAQALKIFKTALPRLTVTLPRPQAKKVAPCIPVFNLLEILRWRRWKLISRLVLSVTASGKVLTAFYSCLRLNRLLTSEPQTLREGLESVSIFYSQR